MSQSDSRTEVLKRAYLEMQSLRAELREIREARSEPIAVIGMACRMPGGVTSPEELWSLVRDGRDAITTVPPERWDVGAYYDPNPDVPGKMYTRWGGFVDGVENFDAQFFGINPKEASSMDPQQRMLLEVAWEALENAGRPPDQLVGSRTGVYVGLCSSDYFQRLFARDAVDLDAYMASGGAHSVGAGRISYILGLQGPCIALDTACSSSLVTVHLAVQSLRARECDLALTGGANLILAPELNIVFSRLGMLARDGRCKTFDASADGYIRSEGCGMVVLKRLSDAVRDGDSVLAVIRGSAINQDGRSGGLTVPNGPAQESVIRDALASGHVNPSDVTYVEAHGTGTSLGDPIEVRALGAVYGENRSVPLVVGALKTNLGHLEAAAGVAGLIKAVLVLQHGEIPPNIHLKHPNPHIPWGDLPVLMPSEAMPWPEGGARLAGVSSFGFSGTNAHVVLEALPEQEMGPPASSDRPWSVLALSAKTASALDTLANRYERLLSDQGHPPFADVCFTANAGRSHFSHRLAVVARSAEDAAQRLRACRTSEQVAGMRSGKVHAGARPKVAFLFPGQPFAAGAGRELYQTQGVFQRALDECEALLQAQDGPGIIRDIVSGPANRAVDSHPALFSMAYALGQLWLSWGVEPAALLGCGVGEHAAACLAGVMSLKDALMLIDPVLPQFEEACRTVSFEPPRMTLISTVTGEAVRAPQRMDAEHWRRHARQAVRFADGMARLREKGCTVVLEMGTASTLVNDVQGEPFVRLASLDPGRSDWEQMLDAAAGLYVSGITLDWQKFDAPWNRRKTRVPNYPFERTRHWIEGPRPPREAWTDWLHEVQWLQVEPPHTLHEVEGEWLLFAEANGQGEALAASLRSTGLKGTVATSMDELCAAVNERHYAGVVHLAALDFGRDLESDHRKGTGSLLGLVQCLLARKDSSVPRIWIVTSGAQPFGAGVDLAPSQAMLWGLGKTLALEHPEIWGGLIDLDPADSPAGHTTQVLQELSQPDEEDQVVYRNGARWVPRVAHSTMPLHSAARFTARPDATYLITGGLGRLGLKLARWLSEAGAKSILLVGRRGLPERSQWDNPETPDLARQVAAVRSIEANGVRIRAVAADVADREQMQALLRALPPAAPLRGVIHAAAAMNAWALKDARIDDSIPMFRAKVLGTTVLDELTRDCPLDFFVTCSSTTSLLGAAHLAHYAAFNQFQDTFAWSRRARGLPALTINFGLWDETSVGSENERLFRLFGMQPMDAAQALNALEYLLGSAEAVQQTVASIDWDTLVPLYEAKRRRPFLSLLRPIPSAADDHSEGLAAMKSEIDAAPPSKRWSLLVSKLEAEVGAVMGFGADHRLDPQSGFFEMGMDSLTSVQLKKRLEAAIGRSLPPTIAFNYPTIEKLAGFLAREVFSFEPPASATEPAPEPVADAMLAALSADELKASLLEELKEAGY